MVFVYSPKGYAMNILNLGRLILLLQCSLKDLQIKAFDFCGMK